MPSFAVHGATGIPAATENTRGLLPGLGSGLAGSIKSNYFYSHLVEADLAVRDLNGFSLAIHGGLVGQLNDLGPDLNRTRYFVSQFDPSMLYLGWHAMEQIEVPSRMPWLSSVLTRIDVLRSLAPGWDSVTSQAVSEDVIQRTLAFLRNAMQEFTPPPSIVPLESGGLQIEWHRAGYDVEIEFEVDMQKMIYVHELASGTERESTDPTLLFNELALSYRLAAGYDPANDARR
jgi:hypothetical protein